ncbi:MAG TPA: antitoxin Xre/MbcA/ParS toxin-binding domain-containing protein [Chthoniobacteraceae bacterium]|jgi:putative toxin-antitoxin system antitoxin component (TIGR02293 family)
MEQILADLPLKEAASAATSAPLARKRTARPARGVVAHCVHAPSKAAARDFTPANLIVALRAGLPVAELLQLQESLGLSMEKLLPMLGMSKATLHRRKASGRLDPLESDRVVRFARLFGRAIEVMEAEDAARHWMGSPQIGLGGAVPLDYARTEVGAREVEDLLGRIDYGVYS